MHISFPGRARSELELKSYKREIEDISGPFAPLPVLLTVPSGRTLGFDIVFHLTSEKPCSAICTLTTNDPLHPHPTIPLTGSGGRPHTYHVGGGGAIGWMDD
jgi:hypothetical protein